MSMILFSFLHNEIYFIIANRALQEEMDCQEERYVIFWVITGASTITLKCSRYFDIDVLIFSQGDAGDTGFAGLPGNKVYFIMWLQ